MKWRTSIKELFLYFSLWLNVSLGGLSCPFTSIAFLTRGRHGPDPMVIGFTTTSMKSVPITTDVVDSTPAHVIKFVSDLRQVGDFRRVLRFPPPMKLTATI